MSSPIDSVKVAACLVEALRHEGLVVGVDRTQQFVRAAAACGELYWAGRLTLVSRPEDIAVYDQVYHGLLREPEMVEVEERLVQDDDAEGEDGASEPSDSVERQTSSEEILRHTHFEELTEDDLIALARAIESARRRPIVRTTRRRRRHPSRGRVDLRRTMREVHRLGGEPVPPSLARRRTHVQPVTFMIDVSGSMAEVSRPLLLATAAFVRADHAHEAFTFGTRLTRVTSALRSGELMHALDAAAELAEDRDAGTRIGEALEQLLDTYGQTRTVRSAIVVIYCDGLDRGDPLLLERQMARVALRARKVIWLNPLSASPQFEPLARGMKAALPYVDVFGSGHDMASFTATVDSVLDRLSTRGRSR